MNNLDWSPIPIVKLLVKTNVIRAIRGIYKSGEWISSLFLVKFFKFCFLLKELWGQKALMGWIIIFLSFFPISLVDSILKKKNQWIIKFLLCT